MSRRKLPKPARRRKLQESGKEPSRFRTYSFVATAVIILVIIVASYAASLPRVEPIPKSFVFKPQPWMSFVPSRTRYVSYINYERAYAAAENRDVFGLQAIVFFGQLNFSIFPREVIYEIDVQLPESEGSPTITILNLENQQLIRLTESLRSANKTSTSTHGSYTIHAVVMRIANAKKLDLGYLTFTKDHVLLSSDRQAQQGVEKILDQYDSRSSNLFDDPSVRRAIYASGITDDAYVALFVGMFSTQMADSQIIAKSILQEGSGIVVTRSILFPTEEVALNRFAEAHRVYRDAASYRILDSYLVIMYRYQIDRLKGELSGI